MKECKIFMTSGRCAWGECFACGWGKIMGPDPDMHKLKEKIDDEFRDIKNCDRLKIFVSGSFMDEKQFPRPIIKYVVKKCKESNVKELIVESRPEFITDNILKEFEGQKLIVAIGLEIADDKLRRNRR